MSTELLYFNGVDGESGEYLMPPMSAEPLSQIARGEKPDEIYLGELKWFNETKKNPTYGTIYGVDAKNLAQAGWGVIFAYEDLEADAIKDALKELLSLRREQAGEYYKEYCGTNAYRPNEGKHQFLIRHGVGPGPVDPKKVPYYLLIVGSPELIPYDFQYQLDVQYAVGRLHFEKLEDYANYARSVVVAESGKVKLPRRAVFFGVQNPDDKATNLSAQQLVKPLAESIAQARNDWNIQTLLAEEATKEQLRNLLTGEKAPALLFTASHGMGFPNGSERQLPHQGALLCQDWLGPKEWRKPIPAEHYFSADDVSNDARLLGLITFHFACYGGGTPKMDDFAHQALSTQRQIAPHAFVACLPQRLLSHPKGGALAVIAHVERAWGYSFIWNTAGQQLQVFESTLKCLMEGYPVGLALEFFNERYAELSVDLSNTLHNIKYGVSIKDLELAGMWTANNDARGYAIIGDPAVRLPIGDTTQVDRRPVIELPVLHVQTTSNKETKIKAGGSLISSSNSSVDKAPLTLDSSEIISDFNSENTIKNAQLDVIKSLQNFAEKAIQALEIAFDNDGSLEITTYVSDDLTTVRSNKECLSNTGTLLALTRVDANGSTFVCVPSNEEKISERLWKIHSEAVQNAQTNRAEMLKVLGSTLTQLIEAQKKA